MAHPEACGSHMSCSIQVSLVYELLHIHKTQIFYGHFGIEMGPRSLHLEKSGAKTAPPWTSFGKISEVPLFS